MKIESDAGAEFGRWTVDGHPQSIEFPPSFWGEILPAVMADFLRLPWGGPEVGGVLFGSREPACLRILAFRLLECEHAKGPAFELSENDELRLRHLLESARTDEGLAGLEAVGWYHSKHQWLVLTERDIKLYDQYFPEPWQIAMVFLRRRSQPCLLTLFFRREDGSIASSQREFSLIEAQPEAAPPPAEPAPEPAPEAPSLPPRPEPSPEVALEPEEIAPAQTSLNFWGFGKKPLAFLRLWLRIGFRSPGVRRHDQDPDNLKPKSQGHRLIWLKQWFTARSDRRDARRSAIPGLTAYYYCGEGVSTGWEVLNLSVTGAYIRTQVKWSLGTIAEVTIQQHTSPDGKSAGSRVVARGPCRVVRWGLDGFGVRFLFPEASTRKELRKLVKAATAGRT